MTLVIPRLNAFLWSKFINNPLSNCTLRRYINPTLDHRQMVEADSQDPLTWHDFLFPKERYLRNIMWLVLGLGFWQQATGSEAVLYYSSTFLENAGLVSTSSRLLGYIGIGSCKVICDT